MTEDCAVTMGRLDENGVSNAGSVLKIANVPMASHIALIFKVEYTAIVPTG